VDAATERRAATSLHQEHGAAALDFARDFAMQMRRHAGHAARKDLAAFGYEFSQEIGILVIDRFDRDIDATPWHRPICAAKCGAAFGGFGLHTDLLRFAMERVFTKKRVVFLFL
jgi:hypothetical protein